MVVCLEIFSLNSFGVEKSVKIICTKISFSLKKPLLFEKKDLSLRHAPAGSR